MKKILLSLLILLVLLSANVTMVNAEEEVGGEAQTAQFDLAHLDVYILNWPTNLNPANYTTTAHIIRTDVNGNNISSKDFVLTYAGRTVSGAPIWKWGGTNWASGWLQHSYIYKFEYIYLGTSEIKFVYTPYPSHTTPSYTYVDPALLRKTFLPAIYRYVVR